MGGKVHDRVHVVVLKHAFHQLPVTCIAYDEGSLAQCLPETGV